MDELFGESNDGNLPMPDVDDETATALAVHHGLQTASELRRAKALVDLRDALVYVDTLAGAPILARSASKRHGQTGLAVAEQPAPTMVRARLRPNASILKPSSRMAGKIWLAACLCIAAFFGVRFIGSVAAPDRSVALSAASSSFDRDAAVARLTTGYANLPPDEKQLALAGGIDLHAAPQGYHTFYVQAHGARAARVLVHNASKKFCGVHLEMKFTPEWDSALRAVAKRKCKALTNGDTRVVHSPSRSTSSASSRYKTDGDDVPKVHDVDHTIDLQLNGPDVIRNIRPLDSSVNRSLGAHIYHLIKTRLNGTVIRNVAITD